MMVNFAFQVYKKKKKKNENTMTMNIFWKDSRNTVAEILASIIIRISSSLRHKMDVMVTAKV